LEATTFVHVNASGITLGAVLAQLGEGKMDRPVYFANRNLSNAERNYTTTWSEGITPCRI